MKRVDAAPVCRDRDYLETEDGWFFCVVGDLHSRDRVVAYPKYAPGQGPWRSESRSYRRLMSDYSMEELVRNLDEMRGQRGEYTYFDSYFGTEMSCVPWSRVLRHLKTRERLNQLHREKKRSLLINRLFYLVDLLSAESGVKRENFGVTGSILLGIQQEFSDLDLVVYGGGNFGSVRRCMEKLRAEGSLGGLPAKSRAEWIERRLRSYPLAKGDLGRILERTGTRGTVDGTTFSLHAVRLEDEVTEKYGDWRYRSLGLHRVRAIVVEAGEGCYNPALYRLKDAVTDDTSLPVSELASYDGTFASVFQEGDVLELYGKLEVGTSAHGEPDRIRLLLGTFEGAGKEFARLL
ncbi:MAG: hypothetical protein OEW84_06020 [Aigarchaeota archaeon]|nr:hypothetical protein [Aigarchaeota archaeon]